MDRTGGQGWAGDWGVEKLSKVHRWQMLCYLGKYYWKAGIERKGGRVFQRGLEQKGTEDAGDRAFASRARQIQKKTSATSMEGTRWMQVPSKRFRETRSR
jgi:hypothetical protein